MLIRKGLKNRIDGPGKGDSDYFTVSAKNSRCPYLKERIIFHLDLDAFFAQVEEVAHPEFQGKPIFVVGHSMTSGIVLTANYTARRYGIKTGMPLREARGLCPGAVLIPADCSKYTDTSDQIFAHLETYTPLVEIFSIDEAFMDVTDTCAWGRFYSPRHSESHFGGDADEMGRRISEQDDVMVLAGRIKRWVFENFGLTLSVGIAPNKLLAKLASERLKPDGLFRIRAEEVEEILGPLPVEELCGIGDRMKAHLNSLGIFTASELGRFSERILYERFGVIGLVLKRMGQGIDPSPVLPAGVLETAKSMGHSYTLTRPTRDRELAFRYLLWLSEKTARRLRRRGCEGRTIHTVLRFSDFETAARQKNLDFFVNDGKQIFESAKKIFAQIDQPRRPIRLLGVSVSGLRAARHGEWLFEEFKKRERLLETLDRINDKYGEFTLRPARLAFPGDEKVASRSLQLFGSGRH